MEQNNKIALFQEKPIRKAWHQDQWWFVIEDVVQTLTNSANSKGYIRDVRRRDPELSKGWGQIAHTLSVDTEGGKQKMNCANIEGVFRIIMSIPSPKAEPLKLWLAEQGKRTMEEIENPELLTERQIELYKAKGYPDEWIKERISSIETRNKLTEEWQKRGVKEGKEYSILTAVIAKGTFDLTPTEHREVKGLTKPSQNLRDHMTDLELIFMSLGEALTRRTAIEDNSQGFDENKISAVKGGYTAGEARKRVEELEGKKVVSSENFLKEGKNKGKQNLPPADQI